MSKYRALDDMNVLNSLMNENDRLEMIKGIAKTMLDIHKANVLHGNLKLSNLLIDEENHIFISDISQYLLYPSIKSEKYKCNKEIHNYLSPNILKGKLVEKYDDIWSFCCVLYRLVTVNEDAFQGRSLNELINNIITITYPPLKFTIPFEIRNILFFCFNVKNKENVNFEWIYNELTKIDNKQELYTGEKCDLNVKDLLTILEEDPNVLNKKYILDSINESEEYRDIFLFENINKYINNEIYLKLAIDSVLFNCEKYKNKVIEGEKSSRNKNKKNIISLLNSIKKNNEIEFTGENYENIEINFNHITYLYNLKILKINNVNFNEEKTVEFEEVINTLKNLEYLSLSNNKLTDIFITLCFSKLSKELKYMNVLDLSNNRITKTGLKIFEEKMKYFPSLKTLNLSHNPIYDKGFNELSKCFSDLKVLNCLDLSSCVIKTIDESIDELNKLEELKELHLEDNLFTAEYKERLVGKLSDMKELNLIF